MFTWKYPVLGDEKQGHFAVIAARDGIYSPTIAAKNTLFRWIVGSLRLLNNCLGCAFKGSIPHQGRHAQPRIRNRKGLS